MDKRILKTNKLTKQFSGNFAIKDVSLELKEGEVICIVGPSGSGKSTLLKLIADLQKSDSGEVSFFGEEKERMVYVAQDYNLWPHKTVIENIITAPMLVNNISKKEAIKNGEELLKKFNLIDKLDQYPNQLSGGQKQRIALIRALAMKPKVLLLDEITSSLDPELVKSILDTIRVFAKEGQSMIIVTHHISFATEVGDRILFLEDGKVIQEATARDFVYAQTNDRINEFIKQLSSKEQEITVYEGEEQYQSFHIGLMKRLQEGSTLYVAGSVGDRWIEPMGKYYEEYEKLRLKKNIKWQMLAYELGEVDMRLYKEHRDLNDFRILPSGVENPANYFVIGDTVVLQTFGKKPSVIEIKNEAIAKSYMNYFNDLWKVGKVI